MYELEAVVDLDREVQHPDLEADTEMLAWGRPELAPAVVPTRDDLVGA